MLLPNTPPDYGPDCGGRLEPVDSLTLQQCQDCGESEFVNPIPTGGVAVLDGESVHLVKVDLPDRHLWDTPGGIVEVSENPDVAGARELREETTLRVDPKDMVLFDVRTFLKFEEVPKTTLCYAVDAADVSGVAEAKMAAARYWTPADLDAAAADRLLTSWPDDYKDLQWWIDRGRATLRSDGDGIRT